MKRDVFEQKIKSELFEYKMPIDASGIWADVEQRLYPKKRNKIMAWIWWGGASLALLLGVAFTMYTFSSQPQVPTPQHVVKAPLPPSVESTPPSSGLTNSAAIGNSSKQTNRTSSHSPANSSMQKHSTDATPMAAQVPTDKKISAVAQTQNPIRITPANDHFIPAVSTPTPARPAGEEVDLGAIPGLPSILSRLVSDRLWHKNMMYVLLARLAYASEELSDRQQGRKAIKSTPTLSHALSTQLGYGFVRRKLSAEEPYGHYMDLRNTSESVLEALQAELDWEVEIRKHWRLKLGVHYTRINEQLDYSYTGYRDDALQDTVVTYFKDNTRSVSINTRGAAFDSSFHTYNSHEFIGASLLGGYRWTVNKWMYSLSAGAKYSIVQRSRGYQVNDSEKVVQYDSGSDLAPLYRTSGSLWLTSVWSAGYRWRANSEWTLSLSNQFMLNPINNATYNPIGQRYQLHFVQLGYRHLF